MRIAVLVAALSMVLFSGCRSSSKDDLLPEKPAAEKKAGEYERPAGVEFHITAILGMNYTRFQGSEMETYLGQKLEEERLPGLRGRKIRYGQGELMVAREEIYAVAYEFPRPVSKLEAVHLTGLPESILADFRPSSMEMRIDRSSYGFRRLVLTRAEPDQEQFIRIEAWKFLPRERF